ncbi:MAG: class II glutamine amidotransferase [Planctomycetaceae bacterium]|nr:class II glutamine amidotransferase [Planctomycetaceae bacterium]
MCRLYGFRANEDTKVECTLVHAQNALLMQSRSDMIGRAHPDGWGIAFYHGECPEVEHSAAAAFEDMHFSNTAERIFTQTVVAHVRLATVGGSSVLNSHPFVHGHWTFAHNGTVRGFETLREELIAETLPSLRLSRRGQTDSEHSFYWLLSRMSSAGIKLEEKITDADKLIEVVRSAVVELNERCARLNQEDPPRLNFLLTDGHVMIVTRWNNSLYWVSRVGVHDCEICGIPHVKHHTGTTYHAVVIASEPISHEEWQEVPNQHLLFVDSNIDCRLIPMGSQVSETSAASLS